MSQKSMALLEECIPVFTMLQDKKRQQILIDLFDHGEMTVVEITKRLAISRPTVSHHLKLMLDAKLLSVRQEGKERYYRVDARESISKLGKLLQSLKDDFDNQLKN